MDAVGPLMSYLEDLTRQLEEEREARKETDARVLARVEALEEALASEMEKREEVQRLLEALRGKAPQAGAGASAFRERLHSKRSDQ
mmetsp:Transcript_10494/g.34470  ORF Transcript_10494/g.34470 Transcript_10494/m.34470 type:complete len:86 (+) Transcript_10494:82-339(+)